MPAGPLASSRPVPSAGWKPADRPGRRRSKCPSILWPFAIRRIPLFRHGLLLANVQIRAFAREPRQRGSSDGGHVLMPSRGGCCTCGRRGARRPRRSRERVTRSRCLRSAISRTSSTVALPSRGAGLHLADVGLQVGDRRDHAGQDALAVVHDDLQLDLELRLALVGPLDADLAVGVEHQVLHVRDSSRCARPRPCRASRSRRSARRAAGCSTWRGRSAGRRSP